MKTLTYNIINRTYPLYYTCINVIDADNGKTYSYLLVNIFGSGDANTGIAKIRFLITLFPNLTEELNEIFLNEVYDYEDNTYQNKDILTDKNKRIFLVNDDNVNHGFTVKIQQRGTLNDYTTVYESDRFILLTPVIYEENSELMSGNLPCYKYIHEDKISNVDPYSIKITFPTFCIENETYPFITTPITYSLNINWK